MNILELRDMLNVAIDLGHGEAELVVNQSRDGNEAYVQADARFLIKGDAQNKNEMLVVG